jgi:hypothetical protein
VVYELETGGLRYWMTAGDTVPYVLTRDMCIGYMYLFSGDVDVLLDVF